MKDRVRVAMIGTSWWADQMHLPAVKSHPDAELTSICGRDRQRAGELALKYGIPNVFTDYRDLIRHGGLDAVIVAVPDDLHYPITMAALDAGLHVVCEKPLAFSLDEARAMLAKAESAGVRHMTYFTYRWAPHLRYLCQLVEEGYIGECRDAQFRYVGSYARGAGHTWKWDREHGLGVLGDLGSHMFDLARLLVGEITEVNASLSVRVDKPDAGGRPYEAANDSASVTLRFASGATGTVFVSAAAELGERGQEQGIVLYGEKGTLEAYTDARRQTVRGLRSGESEFQTLPVPESLLCGIDQRGSLWTEQFTRLFTEQEVGVRLFIDGIAQDRPVSPSFYDGMRAQAVIEAALESDRTGCWATVTG